MKQAVTLLMLAASGVASANSRDLADFLSRDRSSGVFFTPAGVSIGSVIYAQGKIVDKGVESKSLLHRIESKAATCLVGNHFSMALPKRNLSKSKLECGGESFTVIPVKSGRGEELCIHLVGPKALSTSPRWYNYSQGLGVTKISFDPRGILFNTLFLSTGAGLRSSRV